MFVRKCLSGLVCERVSLCVSLCHICFLYCESCTDMNERCLLVCMNVFKPCFFGGDGRGVRGWGGACWKTEIFISHGYRNPCEVICTVGCF